MPPRTRTPRPRRPWVAATRFSLSPVVPDTHLPKHGPSMRIPRLDPFLFTITGRRTQAALAHGGSVAFAAAQRGEEEPYYAGACHEQERGVQTRDEGCGRRGREAP